MVGKNWRHSLGYTHCILKAALVILQLMNWRLQSEHTGWKPASLMHVCASTCIACSTGFNYHTTLFTKLPFTLALTCQHKTMRSSSVLQPFTSNHEMDARDSSALRCWPHGSAEIFYGQVTFPAYHRLSPAPVKLRRLHSSYFTFAFNRGNLIYSIETADWHLQRSCATMIKSATQVMFLSVCVWLITHNWKKGYSFLIFKCC